MDRNAATRIVHRLAERAGIEHRDGCHALRHANYVVAAFIAGQPDPRRDVTQARTNRHSARLRVGRALPSSCEDNGESSQQELQERGRGMTKLRQGRAVLSGLTVAAVLAAAGAGWLLSPSNTYTDGWGVVHNPRPAWEVPAGVALALLAGGFLVLMWRMADPETRPFLVLGVAAPLAAVAFLLAVGLRGSTVEVVGADIGAGLYRFFVVPLMLGLLATPVIATMRRRRRA